MTRVALVGCGMIADAHVREVGKVPDAQVVAVCDREPLMAAQLAERHGIVRHYVNFEEMLSRETPDILHVLTPPATHCELSVRAMGAGCNVLVEKPFALNGAEARTMIETSRSSGRKIMVNHFLNFTRPALELRRLLAEGELGEIVHVESFYSYSLESPVARALMSDPKGWIHALPAGVLQNNVDHLIAKVAEFLEPPVEVFAIARSLNNPIRSTSGKPVLNELRVVIGDQRTTAYASFTTSIRPFQHTMVVYGTRNTARLDYESRTVTLVPSSELPGPFGKLVQPLKSASCYLREGMKNWMRFARSDYHFYSGLQVLLSRFYESVKQGSDPPLSHDHTMLVCDIIDRILEQLGHEKGYKKGEVRPVST